MITAFLESSYICVRFF